MYPLLYHHFVLSLNLRNVVVRLTYANSLPISPPKKLPKREQRLQQHTIKVHLRYDRGGILHDLRVTKVSINQNVIELLSWSIR